jgi:NADH-quinone oxidoreductase subunit M
MILAWLIFILPVAGLLAWLVGQKKPGMAKWIALGALSIELILLVRLWIGYSSNFIAETGEETYLVFRKNWIPAFGIEFHLELDGLGLVMLLLTAFLGILAVLVSWNEINKRSGFYYFNLLWALAGIMGVFTAFDLFLFYLFWEVMLIPMYFLISIWGHANRVYASYKFFIYTQVGGLLMFIAILALYVVHGTQNGTYTFDYWALLDTQLGSVQASWLMYGFIIAFFIKLPVLPFHNWLPDAHAEAPTAGSVILAGLLLKTGAYGLLRIVIPFFPDAARSIALPAMILGVCGILYGAKLAFAQTDLKRLIAYTSVSHMGFVVIGIFAFNALALQGVIMQLVAHGLSTGALFILAGMLYARTGTRDLEKTGGLWASVPRMGAAGLILVMASLGLPGLANFVAEFMILAGTFRANHLMAIIAALGLIGAAIYALRMMQKIFYGEQKSQVKLSDLNIRETVIIASVVFLLVFLGFYPRPVTETVVPAIDRIIQRTENPATDLGEIDVFDIKEQNKR